MQEHAVSSLNKKSFFAIIFIIVITVGCVFSMFSLCTGMLSYLGITERDETLTWTTVNYENEYPFKDISGNETTVAKKSRAAEIADLIEKKANSGRSVINRFVYQDSLLYSSFCYTTASCNKILGRNLIEDSEKYVYRDTNGKLLFLDEWIPSEDAYSYISDFSDWLKTRGSEFLYIVPISINDDSVFEFPKGLESGYSKANEAFMKFMTEHNVDYLDTKPLLLSENDNFLDWVYATDHHWTVRAGLSVTKRTLEIMKDNYALDIDPGVCDISNYKSVIYEDAFLGSLGRKTTTAYCDVEDLEVLYPSFDTEFTINIPAKDIETTGSFEKTVIAENRINYDLTQSAYGAFMHGDLPLIRIENKNCDSGVRILMLKESKANVITPYLACAVEYLDIIDPRYFTGSIRSFVEKTDPDIVMICSTGPNTDEDTTWHLK